MTSEFVFPGNTVLGDYALADRLDLLSPRVEKPRRA